jgi:hypothetical protein
MSDVEQQLAALRQQADQARHRRAVAEAERQRAENEIRQALEALKAEFGCETIEAAQALHATLQEQAQQEIMNVQAALSAAQPMDPQ